MEIRDSIIGFAVGAAAAGAGGILRLWLAAVVHLYWGIFTPFPICLTLPVLGGVLGWIGAQVALGGSTSRGDCSSAGSWEA